MQNESKYILSFTAASLRLNEMIKIAIAEQDNNTSDLNLVKESGIVFSSGKQRTTDREFREIRKRLEKLTPKQKDILIHGDLISQKHMAFLAVCKHLAYIRDFTIEVIRDKVLMFDYQLNESDYNSFLNTKMISHPELEGFSSSTLKKAKQVMYRILEQSGIINNPKEKKILHQILLQDVVKAIRIDNPEWFKIFMISDIEIKELSK